ncbi:MULTISPECIES: type 1 glutamine amidotransferase [Chryseobacterium]|jgi:GMP synthase-like glutamine amidotransferase|uniref:GMP synthase n=1 Tax=Chryseobacterium rhizosphaerae TaxID=395937 RepID=A0AAE3Y493_9FLAO|nr:MULTISPECIES: GMP synthase [Chryseobacterium]MBL3546741.1 GMP synthase [Chryseobacterium sp. KMC2]MDC8099885.1 GMP synthase [Chryseobacterium rhizosphaerae]MDR6524709.1 GMP synthase-like glutamine amidotransferase [Chryseobacterium rhizosphaerae]MDR6547107.1 GMP synthase-like glutamine amidotransferase [Chryseobacterium rhizosphaerae]REC73443.1 GMP synthase [Chryseobacterium rhizosphaerae]
MKDIRIALLDMNNNHVNQGFRNIKEISETFQQNSEENVVIKTFDVRFKDEMPEIGDFDIFISSGGPGNPHREGLEWENRFAQFLDAVFEHNQDNEDKKYLFLICHSFQLASIHWNLGNICKRKSYSFGVMPVHKTKEGKEEFLFKNLQDPFYAVDSRAYQFIEPDHERFEKLGMKIVAIEKSRPHINLERAIMAVRFSDEIFGTQFHPEASPEALIENLKDDKNREAMIENFGMEKYLETMDRIDDEDKIILTRNQILPRFLQFAKKNILNKTESLA